MTFPSEISIEAYNYDLPDHRIARYPLPDRASSKLLHFDGHALFNREFRQLPELLPDNTMLVFNETRVVNARMIFKKPGGATIEIFCLEPVEPVHDFQLAFQQSSGVVWKCLIGNAKRWKSGILEKSWDTNQGKVVLKAEKTAVLDDGFLIRFTWAPDEILFLDIISSSGIIPLPPYLNRTAEPEDHLRYQTIYARTNGSVAAPTAGLHFSDSVMDALKDKNIGIEKVTLHVGAGTFKPVSADKLGDHSMHTEKIIIERSTLKSLLDHTGSPVIPVGTTSMRTLESLFWMAVHLTQENISMKVNQWDPYQLTIPDQFGRREALQLLINYLDTKGSTQLQGETQLLIAPGYQFRMTDGLVTNFHQPKSTLLLLVSALIGDAWKEAYSMALAGDYRFLSYGDSCLFLPPSP